MWSRLPKFVALCFVALFFVAACGDDAAAPAALGESCDASGNNACEGDGVCMDDGDGRDRCFRPAGNACDPEGDNPHCAPDTDCFAVDEDDPDAPEGRCLLTESGECDPDEPLCAPDLTCADIEDGTNACHRPVYIEGTVRDSTDESAIEGAHIIALDERKVAVTDVAVSDEGGEYQLALPVERQADGAPIDSSFTLRADAADYQTFPGGLRSALPINTSTASDTDGGWVVSGTPSEIVLIPLPTDQQGQQTISGSVLADNGAGVLVVAEGADTFSAVSDRNGDYTIFNVPAGSFEVHGYAAGLQLEPEEVTIEDEPLVDVDLSESDDALVDVSGSVSIVDPGDGEATSVILVVESTFDEAFARGEVPPGLRAPRTGEPDVTGAWTIEDVPAGTYVVLAAFENDFLVRDPDQNIAGTDFVTVTVDPSEGDSEVSIGESFKVTGALGVTGPGAERPEMVSSAPTLEWEDDSSEDWYSVEVYNAYGDLVWSRDDIDSVSGPSTVTVAYEGPTESGMYYQFRATSWRSPGGQSDSPISRTEDLMGVFYFE
ncbi:MAG: hypothetical protein ACLFVJ_16845 [Persicimonas sp.]